MGPRPFSIMNELVSISCIAGLRLPGKDQTTESSVVRCQAALLLLLLLLMPLRSLHRVT